MNKKNLVIILVVMVLLVLGVSWWLSSGKRGTETGGGVDQPQDVILYWGVGCPHCVAVEEFIMQNQVEQKVNFVRKEVYNNRDYAQEMLQLAKACGLLDDAVGVPFLWDKNNTPQCLVGDVDVINYFKNKIGVQ